MSNHSDEMAARAATKSGKSAAGKNRKSKEWQHVALLKSLEYLYAEACYAKLAMVAMLIGAAVEAVKDEMAPRTTPAPARLPGPAVTISFQNFSNARMPMQADAFDDDDDDDDEDAGATPSPYVSEVEH